MNDLKTVLSALEEDAAHGDIVFPTHTEIALRVQRLLDDPDCATEALGKLISAEPLLSARVLALANAIAYNPLGTPISELKSAISRIGFSALRALTAAVIVRQMKEMSPDPEHRRMAARLWEHTAHVAALARVIARRVTQQNPEAAFFAGIIHEVGGFYLIARAETFPGIFSGSLEGWLEEGEAQLGRAVLRALAVPPPVMNAMETLWSRFLAMPPVSLGDTLLLANELAPVESPFDAIVGLGRKGMPVELDMQIDDETLSAILAESAQEVASLRAALTG